ncbi:hypothetical protein F0185_33010 [Massilia sp. CCM 8692]|uniref:Uncharacterized protein n=1 Tax=Massilia rubra TaxID=2607910 RepID=A0ABX0LU32_9BURK|nr:hypothetical protein [Massilia rubra]
MNARLVFVDLKSHFAGRLHRAATGAGHVFAATIRDAQCAVFIDDECGDHLPVDIGLLLVVGQPLHQAGA